MAHFFCTRKLLDHLGVASAADEVMLRNAQASEPRLGGWYANLIQIERRRVVLYTNERTLFSFLMFKIKANKPASFATGFMQGLAVALTLEGHSSEAIDSVMNEYEGISAFRAATNKKVLGSMNAIAQDLEHFVWHRGGLAKTDISQVTHHLNNTPWGATGYKYASELVAELMRSQRPQ